MYIRSLPLFKSLLSIQCQAVTPPFAGESQLGSPHILPLASCCPQDVALVELGQSDSDSDECDQNSESEEDDSDLDSESEVTEENLKLPGHHNEKKKVNIQVVSQQGEQDD